MGSYATTCSISGLGIDAGTPVRAVLLAESPYTGHDEGSWSLRAPPLRARYDGGGSIEDVHRDDEIVAELWLRGLREDLVEVGTGDNQCHDVPVRKKMKFDDLLAALQEGRVLVRQDAEHFWRRPLKRDHSALMPDSEERRERERYTPSLPKVEALLEADPGLRAELGGKVTGSGLFCGKFVVDEPRPHVVRVRWEKAVTGDGRKKYVAEEETLAEVRQLKRAKMVAEAAGLLGCVVASTACAQGSTELLVFAPPRSTLHRAGPVWYAGEKENERGEDAPLRVSMAMVREDVWQAMCRFPQGDSVNLDCANCGQRSFQHREGCRCPNRSIDGKPLKKHPKSSRYAHGPVFPDGVEHVVVPGSWGETVWYDAGAHRHVVRAAWAEVVEHYCEKAEIRECAQSGSDPFDKWLAKLRKENDAERARVAALPAAERNKIKAAQKAMLDEYLAEERERQEKPVFGDFSLDFVAGGGAHRPGAWIFRYSVPGVISVADHLSMMLADRKPVPPHLLDAVAELAAVTEALHQSRRQWEPAQSTGSQFPEWDLHLRYLKMLAAVAESEIAARNASDSRDANEPPMACAPPTLAEVVGGLKETTPRKKSVDRAKVPR